MPKNHMTLESRMYNSPPKKFSPTAANSLLTALENSSQKLLTPRNVSMRKLPAANSRQTMASGAMASMARLYSGSEPSKNTFAGLRRALRNM